MAVTTIDQRSSNSLTSAASTTQLLGVVWKDPWRASARFLVGRSCAVPLMANFFSGQVTSTVLKGSESAADSFVTTS